MASFQKKMDSIFEIKINQDKICSAFQALELKLHCLSQKIKIIELEKKDRGIFDCSEEEGKAIINQLILKAIRPLQLTSTEHDHTLRNIQYNHNNLSFNMGEDYKNLERRLQESELQLSRKFSEEEVKRKGDLSSIKGQIDENYSLFKQFSQEYQDKIQQHQEEFQRIWDAVKRVRKSPSTNDCNKSAKKTIGYRHSEMKQLSSVVQDNSNLKSKSSFKKQSLIEGGIFQTLNRQKTTQYASLANKVELLEKKLKEMPTITSEQKILSSRRRISNDVSQVNARNGEPLSSEMIPQERRLSKPQKQSRFRNSIQVCNENQQPSIQRRQQRPSYGVKFKSLEQDIRKINYRLTDFKYKYSLLQQNYEIVLNKLSKIGQLQSSMQLKVDEVEKLRVDSSTINEINMRFRKIQDNLEEHKKKYVIQDDFEKEISYLKHLVKEIQAQRSQLARNDEIKSAFEFIERKIKEIVIVLTDKFQNDKEGAINKIQQIRCLTCDKELQGGPMLHKNSFSNTLSRHLKTRNTRTTVKRLKTEGG